MPLSDESLREVLATGSLVVEPEPEDLRIQPASIELRLGPQLLVLQLQDVKEHPDREWCVRVYPVVDLRSPQDVSGHYARVPTDGYVLEPGAFVLGATLEAVSIGPQLCANFDGRSTFGRLGLAVHVTAGFCDPGFGFYDGASNITLEIKNLSKQTIILAAGIGIGQLVVSRMDGKVQRPYGSCQLKSGYGTKQMGPVAPNLGRKL